jgi:hypothetical protein
MSSRRRTRPRWPEHVAVAGQRHPRVAGDADLDDFVTEPSEQLRGRIHRDDRPGMHDGDPVAQSLGLV